MAMREMLRKVRGTAAPAAPRPRPADDPATAIRLAVMGSLEAGDVTWFWASDAQGRLTYLSSAAAERLGLMADADLHGIDLGDLFVVAGEDADPDGGAGLLHCLASQASFRDLAVRPRKQPDTAWWTLDGGPQRDAAGVVTGYCGTARIMAGAPLRTRQPGVDGLTGLADRGALARQLDDLVARLHSDGRPFALVVLDLDRFKQVNDALGQEAGDELLRQAARRLADAADGPAHVGRAGGDRFEVIVPETDDRGELGELAARIIRTLSQPYSLGGTQAIVGASVGIAVAPYDGQAARDLEMAADHALREAKQGGRGQYRFFDGDKADRHGNVQRIRQDLRDALAGDQLTMNYQPIVRADDNRVVAYEALLRWDHPELGLISPATLLPIADQMNLTVRLGEWTLRQACLDAAQWPGTVRVSVNIAPDMVLSGLLLPAIAAALETSGLPADRLELEFSEDVFLRDPAVVDSVFAQLARSGVRLTLDEFGKGISSLTFLRRAPFARVKIDQGFVRGCARPGNGGAAIVAAITGLAGALRMEAVAAGVEAMDELLAVRRLGASLIQGFIFSRPVPQELVLAKLAAGDNAYEPAGPERYRPERRSTLRRIGVIHDNHRYQAVLRDISRKGALIEGLLDVPVGTELVLDLGEGQLAMAIVRRSQDATQGVEFETPLVSDGAGGLCTRRRVLPGAANGDGAGKGRRRFLQVDVSAGSSRAA